jgi:ketosteroid isomerase-like protein
VTSDVVERYLAAVGGQDWVALGGCLADDVVRIGPYGDVYSGRDEYVAYLRGVIPLLPGYRMDVTRVLYVARGGRSAVAEITETIDRDGAPFHTPEAIVFDLTPDRARITRLTIYLKQPA